MGGEISAISDLMLPKATLPDVSLLFMLSSDGSIGAAIGLTLARKIAFNQAPTHGKVSISVGEGPNTVEVVRQQDKGFDLERVALFDGVEDRSK